VFWDVTPCGSCKNRRFGKRSPSIIMVTRIGELGTALTVTSNWLCRLLVTANVVPSSPILVTLMMEVPPKSRFLQEQHGVISLKTAFFIIATFKTSDLS
jgi:hypothetical protein